MKRLFLFFTLIVMAFSMNAQMRIVPMREITQRTYEEVVEIVDRIIYDKHEHSDYFTTRCGEVIIEKESRIIVKISIAEFTEMLNEHISTPSRRIYGIGDIQTELIVQTSDLYKYISIRLSRNRMVKNIKIKINSRTGGAYIQIYLNKR